MVLKDLTRLLSNILADGMMRKYSHFHSNTWPNMILGLFLETCQLNEKHILINPQDLWTSPYRCAHRDASPSSTWSSKSQSNEIWKLDSLSRHREPRGHLPPILCNGLTESTQATLLTSESVTLDKCCTHTDDIISVGQNHTTTPLKAFFALSSLLICCSTTTEWVCWWNVWRHLLTERLDCVTVV